MKGHSVHSFRELPLLYMTGDNDMGYPRKVTPLILDRIVQVIWWYQHEHNGETPEQIFIYNELAGEKLLSGNSPSSMTLFTKYLIDEDRIEVISRRPYRVTIREKHPKNKRAIKQAIKALTAAGMMPSDEPPTAVLEGPADVIVCDTPAEVLRETAEKLEAAITGPEPGPEPEPTLGTRSPYAVYNSLPKWASHRGPMNWNELDQLVKSLGGDLTAIASQFVLSTAKPGDLLEQLLDRGYTISKTNPRWRD